MIKNILFDLDGTLLPMDMQNFIDLYFKALTKRFCPVLEISPKVLIKAIWQGTNAMINNDGTKLNKDRFWEECSLVAGEKILDYQEDFDDFYKTDFLEAKKATKANPVLKKAVKELKKKGYNLIVATSPVFPKVAVESRLSWADMDIEDFSYITTYENCAYGKPNLEYYKEICEKRNLVPKECMMVGNDVSEDMVSEKIGFQTYLLKDCLINEKSLDISTYKKGSAKDFYKFAKEMAEVK